LREDVRTEKPDISKEGEAKKIVDEMLKN